MSLEVWIPEGIIKPHPTKVVGARRVTISAFPYKWFNADIYNDGPDSVYVFINEVTPSRQPLKIREKIEVKNPAPVIKEIILFCEAGETADVRIYTKR